MKCLSILLLLFLFIHNANSLTAQSIISGDTIYLKYTSNKSNSLNKKKLKAKGRSNRAISVEPNSIILSKINTDKCIDIQNIYLKIKTIKKDDSIKKDYFELVFYSIDENNKPYQMINENTLLFKSNQKNELNINLGYNSFKYCKNFYVGFIKKENSNSNNYTNYIFKARENKNNSVFIKTEKVDWYELPNVGLDILMEYN